MAAQIKARAYQKDVTISMGLMQVSGDLLTPKNTSDVEKFVSICPDCAAGGAVNKVRQEYECISGHRHTQGELAKAKEDEGGMLIAVSQDQINSAKKSELEKNVLELNVHLRDQVKDSTLGGGVSYVFRPSNSGHLYPILVKTLKEHPEYTFIGMMNLRDADKLFQVTLGLNDQLVFQELVWPEDLKAFDTPTAEVKESLQKTAEQFIAGSVSEFVPGEYVKGSRKRLTDLVEWVQSGGVFTPDAPAPVPTTTSDDSLEAMLLAAMKKEKSA